MTTFLRAYLAAVRASVVGGKTVTVGRLVELGGGRELVHEVSDELEALINGLALDLPDPVATLETEFAARVAGVTLEEALLELRAWQESVRDWLLRGTIAPVGDLGWLSVHDETRTELDELTGIRRMISQRQRLRFRPAPQLRAAVARAELAPPIELSRLTALLRAHVTAPVVEVDALVAELDRLGFAPDANAPAAPDEPTPPAIRELWRRCGTRPLAHVRVLADPDSIAAALDALPVHGDGGITAMPFAHDGGVIAYCTRGGADPGVLVHPARDVHRCPDDHPVRLSQWLGAILLAVELETLAPASFPDDALAAIAEELAPLGRIAGELSQLVVAGSAWWASPPAPPPVEPLAAAAHADPWITIEPRGLELRITAGPSGDILAAEAGRAGTHYDALTVATHRVCEIYPVGTWRDDDRATLRLWGCFHGVHDRGSQDGTILDLGPLPGAVAERVAAKLRRAIGLPRSFDSMMSTQGLIGQPVRQWLEVTGTWAPRSPSHPNFDGLFLRLPRHNYPPPDGARLRVRGLFDGPSEIYALQWEVA